MTTPTTRSAVGRVMNPIRIRRGATKVFKLTITQEVEQAGRVATQRYDLTGKKVYFTVKESVEDERAIILKNSDDTSKIEILDQADDETKGQCLIKFVPSDTDTRQAKQYLYGIWVYKSATEKWPVAEESEFEIQPAVVVIK